MKSATDLVNEFSIDRHSSGHGLEGESLKFVASVRYSLEQRDKLPKIGSMGPPDPFAGNTYDPETLAVLTVAFNEAWDFLIARGAVTNPDVMRRWLAARLAVAASRGERDPAILRAVALGLIDPPPS